LSHYFTDNTEMHHNRKEIPFRFLGICYYFTTDAGVFSKDRPDYGSELLLTCFAESRDGNEKEILDLGCGYGLLSVVVSRLTGGNVTAVDINSRAVELTLENKDKNQASVNAIVSDGYKGEKTFDTVITNPPIRAGKEVVYRFFEEAYEHLAPNGSLWVVIRKQQGAPSAMKKLESLFHNCEVITRDKGYYILRCRRMPAESDC